MTVTIKIYQNKMINDILNASSFKEVKYCIDVTISKLKKQDASDSQLTNLFDETLKELKALNIVKLSYEQHANIITAEVHLKELQLQVFNVIN